MNNPVFLVWNGMTMPGLLRVTCIRQLMAEVRILGSSDLRCQCRWQSDRQLCRSKSFAMKFFVAEGQNIFETNLWIFLFCFANIKVKDLVNVYEVGKFQACRQRLLSAEFWVLSQDTVCGIWQKESHLDRFSCQYYFSIIQPTFQTNVSHISLIHRQSCMYLVTV